MHDRSARPGGSETDDGSSGGSRVRKRTAVGVEDHDDLARSCPAPSGGGRDGQDGAGAAAPLPGTQGEPAPPVRRTQAIKFRPAPLHGVYLVEPERRGDDRGFFARMFCDHEFAAVGLESRFVQVNDSLTAKRGTLRGLHYQLAPAAEVKVVRCVRGAIYDVIADLRPDSPTFGKWFGAELSAENRVMMYAPRGFAHAFLTLTDDAETLYLVSHAYAPEQERGLRFDDPWLGVTWPIEPVEVSAKDRAWPSFDPEFHGVERLRGL